MTLGAFTRNVIIYCYGQVTGVLLLTSSLTSSEFVTVTGIIGFYVLLWAVTCKWKFFQ